MKKFIVTYTPDRHTVHTATVTAKSYTLAMLEFLAAHPQKNIEVLEVEEVEKICTCY